MIQRFWVYVMLLFYATCSRGGSSSAPPGPATSAGTAAAAASASVVPDAVRTAVCSTKPCGGEASTIQIYRDSDGVVRKLYRLYGACTHSPGIYFDPDGSVRETIAERPIAPGSDEAKAVYARHAAQVGSLTLAETLSCRDATGFAR